MAPGEVFPNAPLQLVAFEVSFPPAQTDSPSLVEAIRGAIADEGAVIQFAPPGVLRVPSEGGDAEAAMFRIIAVNSTVAVTLWRRSLVIEHTDYEHWADFKALIEPVVAALFAASEIPGVGRIGLRYVDEVHVPTPVVSLADWAPYLHPAFMWPAQLVSSPVMGAAGGFGVAVGSHQVVNVRTALLPDRALNTEGPLVLRPRPASPAFLLDCDGFYQPPDLDTELDGPGVLKIVGELHVALDRIFEDAFTEEARKIFREGPS